MTATRQARARRPASRPRGAAEELRRTSTSTGLAARAAVARARAAGTPRPPASKSAAPPHRRPPRDGATRSSAASTSAPRRVGADLQNPQRGAPGRGSAAPALAPEAPRPWHPGGHLRLVGDRRDGLRSRRRRARTLLAGVAVGSLVVVFGLVYLHVVSAQKQFLIDRLTARDAAVQASYENLRLAVDQRDTPAHILAVAHELGMVQPASVRFIEVPATASAPLRRRPTASGATADRPAAPLAPAGPADWPRIKALLDGGS